MKFRLESDHTWPGDVYLAAGTEVGDDTDYPFYDGQQPSSAMTPLDKQAEELLNRVRADKPHWGVAPEERLPISGDNHPVYKSPQASSQPIIPPPLEQLTRPNDLRPGEPSRVDPRMAEALAAENDRQMAIKANEDVKNRTGEKAPGQGPEAPKFSGIAGQGQAPKPPAPASQAVPRNTSGVVPESTDGRPVDLSKDSKESKDKK